jgi:hypothetical protein
MRFFCNAFIIVSARITFRASTQNFQSHTGLIESLGNMDIKAVQAAPDQIHPSL